MQNRRFTRLTNAFSKKLQNHVHALALYFASYNFCRIHKTLRVTSATQANLTDRVWDMADIVAIIDQRPKAGATEGIYEAGRMKRKPCPNEVKVLASPDGTRFAAIVRRADGAHEIYVDIFCRDLDGDAYWSRESNPRGGIYETVASAEQEILSWPVWRSQKSN